MREQILEDIRGVLTMGTTTLRDDQLIEELVRDSMDMIELVAVLSNEYHIAVNPKELEQIKTVGDIVDYVLAHQNNATKRQPLETF
ncbi:acyl carrier protein [Candidatus Berkelbacteria bacterium]|nr:acyl carrier protein [Candidatus Berkelbacteria bacterium]